MKNQICHRTKPITRNYQIKPQPLVGSSPFLKVNRLKHLVTYFFAGCLLLLLITNVMAHPLGNFTINHFSRIELGSGSINIHYVLDMAEIPTFQEKSAIDTNSDNTISSEELNAYGERLSKQFAANLRLAIDGKTIALTPGLTKIALLPGAGGLPTMRLETDMSGSLPVNNNGTASKLQFEDTNHPGRLGWQEIVATSNNGVLIFNSSVYGNTISNELKTYPTDMLTAPLSERSAKLSFTSGALPSGATALLMRDGRPVSQTRDRLTELIAVPQLTPGLALLGLLLAVLLGGFHALSPGHGKTVVGAYLVGSRGTAKHAAFLGLTVTITHTAGVFALGLITLFASQYILPERIFPFLTLISGAIVVGIGLSLFIKRLATALGYDEPEPQLAAAEIGEKPPTEQHAKVEEHNPEDLQGGQHSHGGLTHSHLPPGADGGQVTWRSLLALGISGGLLPCPSALVVLLSAISLHRIGYGLLLVFMFSLGLAGVLTSIGLLFVYAKRFIDKPMTNRRIVEILPVLSSFVITCVGIAICYEAVGVNGLMTIFQWSSSKASWIFFASILGLLFVLGFKQAWKRLILPMLLRP